MFYGRSALPIRQAHFKIEVQGVQSGVQSADRPVSISVAVMTHNETREFKWLMRALEPARSIIDEIVVVDDFSDEGFVETVRSFEKTWPIRFFQRRLNKNFAAQRNFAKARCRGRLILFPDADELPSERVLMGLPQLLEWMESHDVDACYLPRLNVLVPGSDMADPLLTVDDRSLSSTWEDQVRILRNLPKLRFVRRVDELLSGIGRAYKFPHTKDFVLLHAKTATRIQGQQRFYRSIHLSATLSKHWHSIAKRTFRIDRQQIVTSDPPI